MHKVKHKVRMQIIIIIILIRLTSGKVLNLNTKHSILIPSFGTMYKFQGLLHSFNRYSITNKSILLKEQDVFITEIGHIHKCALN